MTDEKMVYDARGNGDGKTASTITGDHENRITDYTSIVCGAEGFEPIRRLTPLEATRLQMYPDGWVDLGNWTDSRGKTRRESDSAKYNALGNSLALPFWYWLLSRILPHCTEKTMGSLFDGIGGFPLCWTAAGGVVLWNSEIDEFCEAVTTKHFGDEDRGIEGDFYEYFPDAPGNPKKGET